MSAPRLQRVSSGNLSALAWTAAVFLATWLLPDRRPAEAPLLWAFYGILLFFFFRTVSNSPLRMLDRGLELAFSFLVSAAVTLGVFFGQGIAFENMSAADALKWAACAAVLTFPVSRLVRLLCGALARWAEREASREKDPGKERGFFSASPLRCFLICFAVMLICWLPVWLAYDPGLWNYDPWQADQVISGIYSKHHPLLHTLLLGSCYRIALNQGNPNLAPLLYSAVQGVICAAVFALTCTFIRRKTDSRIFFALSLLFFALFPVNPILVMSTTKDTLFAAMILLAGVLFLWEEEESAPRRRKLLAAAEIPVLALVILFRNNAQYCFFLLILLCLFKIRRKPWRRILAVLAAGTVLGVASDRALGSFLKATNVLTSEMCSVPSQMAGRVQAKAEETDAETDAFLKTFYSLGELHYDPALADGTKYCLRLESRGDLIEYIRGSARLFGKYPAICVDSFLYTTRGLWDPQDVSHTRIYGVNNRQGYLPTDIKPGYGIEHHSRLPFLESFLEEQLTENRFLEIPVLRFLYAPALYVFLLLFCCCAAIRGKGASRKRTVFPVFLLLLTGTIALGPGVLPRYVYPLMVSAPLLIWIAMKSAAGTD